MWYGARANYLRFEQYIIIDIGQTFAIFVQLKQPNIRLSTINDDKSSNFGHKNG